VNQDDLELLDFLLSADREDLCGWYRKCDEAALIRASFLMDLYANYLRVESEFIDIDGKIQDMPVLFEAQAVIAALGH